jgi:GDPmannose 4,6-dehydratase
MPTAFITGITGQDGAYLSQFLLDRGYRVVGLVHGSVASQTASWRLQWLDILDRVELVAGDVTDLSSLLRIIETSAPDEVYNLASQSLVATSWHQPLRTCSVTGLGPVNLLEALRLTQSPARFYQASSSEMFGRTKGPMQTEATPFRPRSPYGVAKLHAHWMTVNYRESFGMHATSGILFNHESPLRGVEFVTRKITDGAARIKLGLARQLALGDLNVQRDWGHARDYVRAMWLMLQQDEPGDYVVATGRVRSIHEACQVAFGCVGLNAEDHVVSDATLFRPSEIAATCGDFSKARQVLGWEPSISFEEMIAEMIDVDLKRLRG